MRKLFICSALLMAICYASIARAQGPFNVTFDEYGNSLGGLTSLIGPDPTGGVSGNVLIYILPRPVTNGDLRVWDDVIGGTLSDIVRFTNANGVLDGGLNADRFVFYSLVGGGAPADTGLPTILVPRDSGGVVEQGPPGNRHFDYLPGGTFDNQYHGISEGRLGGQVPEPGSMGMLAGITVPGIIAFVSRRRRN